MPFDQNLWNRDACAVRSLLELKRRKHGVVVAPQTLHADCVAYLGDHWTGGTNTYIQARLALQLGLAVETDTFIDPDRVLKEWARAECAGVLVHTERMPDKDNPELLCHIYHAMLAVDIKGNGLRVWNPTQDGQAHETNYSWHHWHSWLMRATVLYWY